MDYNLSTSLNNHQVYQEMIMDQESLNQQQDEQPPPEIGQPPPPPPPLAQKCPRCDSSDTKFCYYNNYSLSQPRYYCKSCRRYWTHGGTLRNVPVGGGSRKNKRSKTTPSSSSSCSHEINVRSQTSSAAVPSHNLTAGLISGQQLSPFPPAVPPMVTGGAFLSSLAATAAMNSRFGANMTLLQRIGIPLRPHEAPPRPHQFQPSQRSLIPPRPSSSWTQSLFYNGGGSSFWSSNTTAGADGRTQPAVSSSFSPNEWSDNHPGFHPPQ